MKRLFLLIVMIPCLLVPSVLQADIIAVTDPAAFASAIAGRATITEEFDSTAVGTVIASSTSLGGITFTYNWASGESLRVNDNNATNSGSNYLGATNGTGTPVDLRADTNDIQLEPTTAFSAIGMFVITTAGNPPLVGDLRLESAGVVASLARPPHATLDPSMDEVFFLGLYESNGAAMGAVDLVADTGAFGLDYRVDGITYAGIGVPEPNFALLGSLMTMGGLFLRRRQARSPEVPGIC